MLLVHGGLPHARLRENWKEVLMTCGKDLCAAQNTILNRGIRDLHKKVDNWIEEEEHRALAQDAVNNHHVSDNAPQFTDMPDPRLIECSKRVLADLRTQ